MHVESVRIHQSVAECRALARPSEKGEKKIIESERFIYVSNQPFVVTHTLLINISNHSALRLDMRDVGNYVPCGLSPQMHDMPVIQNRKGSRLGAF